MRAAASVRVSAKVALARTGNARHSARRLSRSPPIDCRAAYERCGRRRLHLAGASAKAAALAAAGASGERLSWRSAAAAAKCTRLAAQLKRVKWSHLSRRAREAPQVDCFAFAFASA